MPTPSHKDNGNYYILCAMSEWQEYDDDMRKHELTSKSLKWRFLPMVLVLLLWPLCYSWCFVEEGAAQIELQLSRLWSHLKNCVTQKIVPLHPHLKNHGGAVLFFHLHSDCSTILRQQFFCCWLYTTVLFSHWVLLHIQTANCIWIRFKG